MSEKGESNGAQSTAQNLGSTFAVDGSPPYSDMMPPASSPPHSYQVSAGYGGGDAPLPDSAPPNLKPSGTEPGKKKRGRPRKYAPDGTAHHGVMSPPPLAVSSAGGSLSPTGTHATGMAASPKKKSRGRPSGSGRKHQMDGAYLGSAGAGYGFKPHVITINAGEDVHAKLMSFSQNTSQAICVMSASGAISNVTLRQPATSRGSVTYEGRFEILSLSGSFLFSEVGGERSRTGRLSVSLAGPDGNVIGGGVAGLLIAAAPVQVILGSFSVVEVEQVQKPGHREGLTTPPSPGTLLVSGAKSPPSFGSLSTSSGGGGGGGPASPPPLNQHHLEPSISSPPGVASFSWR